MTEPVTESAPAPDVLARSGDGIGHLTLDRPRAINALSGTMIAALTEALDGWEDDPDVQRVLLDGAGDRGFCAGGDVRALYEGLRAGDPEVLGAFFRTEYALNARIAEYPKPVVVLADGVTMGGGIGLAGHAAVRVVTERSRLAMPETRIGLTPDVGGSWLLSRAPGRLGEYLALTGATIGAADAIAVGLADHLVPAARMEDLRDALRTRADPATATELVLLFDETADAGDLAAQREWIDDAFSAATLPEIVARLQARPEPEAAAALATLREVSPTALAVTLAGIRRVRELPDLRSALAQEYGLMMWLANTSTDPAEGIRALLVDKDRSPTWSPADLDALPADLGEQALAYIPAVPLWG